LTRKGTYYEISFDYFFLISLLGLTACGGGGGGGGDDTPSPSISPAEGLYDGTTSTGRDIAGLVLDDGTIYMLYSWLNYPDYIGGVVQGDSSAKDGNITSDNLVDFNLEGLGILSASMAGNYVPKQSLSGRVTYKDPSFGFVDFSGIYNPDYEIEPSLADLAGTYYGSVSFSLGEEDAAAIISSNGDISGQGASGCIMSGYTKPRDSGNVYDVSITFGGAPCYFANQTFSGIIYYNATDNILYMAAPNDSRTDGMLFVGSR